MTVVAFAVGATAVAPFPARACQRYPCLVTPEPELAPWEARPALDVWPPGSALQILSTRAPLPLTEGNVHGGWMLAASAPPRPGRTTHPAFTRPPFDASAHRVPLAMRAPLAALTRRPRFVAFHHAQRANLTRTTLGLDASLTRTTLGVDSSLTRTTVGVDSSLTRTTVGVYSSLARTTVGVDSSLTRTTLRLDSRFLQISFAPEFAPYELATHLHPDFLRAWGRIRRRIYSVLPTTHHVPGTPGDYHHDVRSAVVPVILEGFERASTPGLGVWGDW